MTSTDSSQVEYYSHVRCYRIESTVHEDAIVALARKLGIHFQYRLNRIDLYVPDTAAGSYLLLKWADCLDHLDFMDYWVPKGK